MDVFDGAAPPFHFRFVLRHARRVDGKPSECAIARCAVQELGMFARVAKGVGELTGGNQLLGIETGRRTVGALFGLDFELGDHGVQLLTEEQEGLPVFLGVVAQPAGIAGKEVDEWSVVGVLMFSMRGESPRKELPLAANAGIENVTQPFLRCGTRIQLVAKC